MSRYHWHSYDEQREYDQGESDARWHTRDYSRDRYSDNDAAYWDGYDTQERYDRERREEEAAEERARERRQEEAEYDAWMEQQGEPEPVYLCGICEQHEACTSVNGFAICSEECAEEAAKRPAPGDEP